MSSLPLMTVSALVLLTASVALFFLFRTSTVTAVRRSVRHSSRVLPTSRIGYGVAALSALGGLVTGLSALVDLSVFTLTAAFVFTIVCLHRLRIPMNAAHRPTSILVVGAHPDDLEIACGSSVAKLVDTGHQVHGLIMTDGAQGGDADIRPDEARAGADFLGMHSLTLATLPDRRLEEHLQEMIAEIEEAIVRANPDMILTHSSNDVHQDHAAVHLAVLRAARNHHSILCFESPSVTKEFSPSIFIDVSDYADVKNAAIAAHANQAGKPYMSRDIVDGITAFRGRQARVRRAEAFEVVRLRLNDPLPL